MKTEDVPQGTSAEDENEAGPSSRSGPLRRYTGVGVKVKFAAGGEVRVMRSLSGGQKVKYSFGFDFVLKPPFSVGGGAGDNLRHSKMRSCSFLFVR